MGGGGKGRKLKVRSSKVKMAKKGMVGDLGGDDIIAAAFLRGRLAMGMLRWVAVAAISAYLAGAAGGADAGAGGTPAELTRQLATIRQQLSSGDFAVREAGQKELEKVPATAVESVRLLVAAEKDPEVKARLETRVAAMELYTLLHPPAISLDVTDASLQEVADAINKQMGGETAIQAQAPRGPRGAATRTGDAKFTLHVDPQPFWRIVEQLNRQSPLNIGGASVSSSGNASFRLTQLPATTAPRPYGFSDTFAYLVGAVQHPGAERWQVNVTFHSDPRVRIASYSSKLQLDKLTDQDGHDLLPLLDTAWDMESGVMRPVVTWMSFAVFRAAPEVQRFREIKGSVACQLLEKEQVIQLDLKDPAPAPVSTPRGTFSVEKDANGDWLLNVSPSADAKLVLGGAAPASASMASVRTLNGDGSVLRTSYASLTASTPFKVTLPPGAFVGGKVLVAWSEKVRDYVLPFSLKNVDALPNSTGPDLFSPGMR